MIQLIKRIGKDIKYWRRSFGAAIILSFLSPLFESHINFDINSYVKLAIPAMITIIFVSFCKGIIEKREKLDELNPRIFPDRIRNELEDKKANFMRENLSYKNLIFLSILLIVVILAPFTTLPAFNDTSQPTYAYETIQCIFTLMPYAYLAAYLLTLLSLRDRINNLNSTWSNYESREKLRKELIEKLIKVQDSLKERDLEGVKKFPLSDYIKKSEAE